jgi:hypothetical protein
MWHWKYFPPPFPRVPAIKLMYTQTYVNQEYRIYSHLTDLS